MKHVWIALALAAGSTWVAPAALAQDFDAGLEAAEAGDYAEALKQWRPLAEQGDADAQYNLCVAYYYSKGVERDHAEAARSYRLAADQGDAGAQFCLAAMYDLGEGVKGSHAITCGHICGSALRRIWEPIIRVKRVKRLLWN